MATQILNEHNLLLLQTAKQVIATEQQAISRLLESINDNFIEACNLLIGCTGRIVVTGIGKSGHIGKKIAASFASLGSPAFFMHAAEALHGDIGMITNKDIVLALSFSGTSNELINLLPSLKSLNVPIISITGNPESPLAKLSNISLNIYIESEACHLNLAPTASTTATLALGDALTIAVTRAKQITKEDFAKAHPGGNLGRRLILKVADIMVTENNMAIANPDDLLPDVLINMTQKSLGMIAIVDKHNKICGIFTDGDLRRFFKQPSINSNFATIPIGQIMNPNYTAVAKETLALSAWQLMRNKKINGLLIAENNTLVGMLNVHTLVAANII